MKKKRFIIGCDPEIRLNFDKYHIEYHLAGKHIGHDHCNKIVEFRPDPGTPIVVVSRLGFLIKMLERYVKKENYDLYLTGGAGTPSTGGHVHFDYLGDDNVNKTIEIMAKWGNKFEMLRPEPGRESRESQGYGNYLDKRINAPLSFEWRAPSSWLSDPRWTYCMLTLGWVAEKNLDAFEASLVSWKQHLKHIRGFLKTREWRMFYPYYNMWYSLTKTKKLLPNFIQIDKWNEFLMKIPRPILNITKDSIEKNNEFTITKLVDIKSGKSVLVKKSAD